MLEFFTNPAFLAVAGMLISVPIIIHLINRMRFKRIRWAAMEFLLKAQKRMRKRLIIEQLILLALRCLLVALAGLLVVRFVGFAGDLGARKPNLHVVLLDDTLSMRDRWKVGDLDRDCFGVAKAEFLQERIGKALARSSPDDRLMILPLSEVALRPDFQPKVYDHLNDPAKFEELKKDLAEMQPTVLHAEMLPAVQKLQQIVLNNTDSTVMLHIISDFRQKEWTLPRAEELYKSLVAMGQANKDMKIHLYDAAEKARQPGQPGFPPSHDNVGIVDLRPSTRIAGKGMPVHFILTVANYGGSQAEVNIVVEELSPGQKAQERVDALFTPSLPLKVPPGDTATVSFDLSFKPQIKAAETHFAHVAARLLSTNRGELPSDGLLEDNVRFAAVEIRERVPVLIVDGLGPKGREDNKDSFHIFDGLRSAPSLRREEGAYQVVYGDEIAGGIAVKALERPDLQKFATIYVMNVPSLSPKQAANLENYVKEGGGVAFFMGPQVIAEAYNKDLYRGGQGVFPVPLKDTYFPPPNQDPLPESDGDTPRLLLRTDQMPDLANYPIFGPAGFEQTQAKFVLRTLTVGRYFQVPRAEWHPEPGKVFELATLPNEDPITRYQKDVLDLTRGDAMKALMANGDYAKYKPALEEHFYKLGQMVAPGSPQKAYELAPALDAMLSDQGKADDKTKQKTANLTEFWNSSDPKVQAVKADVLRLRDEARYGDVLVAGGNFGKGRVVAVMTTAGKDWNNWGGGSLATTLYPVFVWEMQNFLSAQGSGANLAVGAPVEITVDAEQYKQKSSQLKATRTLFLPQEDKPAKAVAAGEQFGQEVKGKVSFHFDKSLEPGLYLTELRYADDAADKAPLAVYSHVFNVDTPAEGPLQRVSSDDLDRELIRNPQLPTDMVHLEGLGTGGTDLAVRRSDLSESPWFFLVILCVLVAEQALAVHLSFHLKGNEADVLSRVTRPPVAAA
jgi:hypothetical protein